MELKEGIFLYLSQILKNLFFQTDVIFLLGYRLIIILNCVEKSKAFSLKMNSRSFKVLSSDFFLHAYVCV